MIENETLGLGCLTTEVFDSFLINKLSNGCNNLSEKCFCCQKFEYHKIYIKHMITDFFAVAGYDKDKDYVYSYTGKNEFCDNNCMVSPGKSSLEFGGLTQKALYGLYMKNGSFSNDHGLKDEIETLTNFFRNKLDKRVEDDYGL